MAAAVRVWPDIKVASKAPNNDMCESTTYDVDRTQKDISNESADHYLMYLQLRGHTHFTQANDSIEFGRNDIVITDGRRPYHAALFDDGQFRRQAIAVLPRSFIEARAPWLRRRPLSKLASNSVYVDLTRRHLLQLTADDLTDGELALLTENLCNLLALVDHAETPISRVQPELQLEALLDFCRRNLHGCSPRNIYALITLCNPGCLSKSERTSSSSSGKQACSHRYRKRLLAF